jgi:hypothetical protein
LKMKEAVESKRGNEVDDEMKEYFEGTLKSKLTKSRKFFTISKETKVTKKVHSCE